jgi:hypothetical protein
MISIIDKLNSGQLHAQARKSRPDCVDAKGNIHASPERARFVNWYFKMVQIYSDDVANWPSCARDEYKVRYVPSR